MKDSLILVHSIPMETRVALIEDGRLAELFMETEDERPLVGNIVKGRVSRVLPGMQAAFVDIGLEKAGFLYVGDIAQNGDDDDDEAPAADHLDIQNLVQEGQDLLVQVTKAPIGTKGARLTNYLTLAGRHLVLTPGQTRVGVSRKLRFAKERVRLRALLKEIAPPNMGLIARTVTENCSKEELIADRDYLLRVWETIQRRAERAATPATVYNELTMPLRVIRDVLSDRYRKILVDDPDEFERIKKFLEAAIPQRAGDVELVAPSRPMLDVYAVDQQLREALRPQVGLPSGGFLVIEETEALTSIDVNTGRFVGSKNLEDTVLKTNLEAVAEIARQLRLRNLGGILILDFIDMDLAENRTKVYNELKEALRRDRAKSGILKISELGLVEMTRQRLQQSLTRAVGQRCPHCQGRGYLTHPRVVSADVVRAVMAAALADPRPAAIDVRAHPWVSDYLLDEALPYLQALEDRFACRIRVLPDRTLPAEQFALSAETPS